MSKHDLTGQKFDHLYVDHRVEDHITKGGNHLVAYECICDCGKHKVVLGQKLRTGRAKSCGECGIYKDNSSIIGRRFNHLVVVKRVEDHVSSGGNKFPAYDCVCDCGRHKIVTAGKLKTNHVMSCGKCGIYDRKIDLTGRVFDKLTVISENGYYEYPNGERDYKWLCKCECGNYVTVRGNSLKAEGNHNCGCYRKELRVTDDEMIDHRFGMLVVVERAEPEYATDGALISRWKCKCDCGNEIIVKGRELRNGSRQSCGCDTRSLPESIVESYLKNYSITYVPQYKFCDLIGLGGGKLSYDFAVFVNDKMLLIELQGGQHYFPVDWFGGEEKFKIQCEHDKLKLDYASSHDIPLLCINCHNKSANYILDKLTNFLSNF